MTNVQMCECVNVQKVAFICAFPRVCIVSTNAAIKGIHLHICTFSHLHI